MDPVNLRLMVNPNMPPDQIADTLLHEMLHAIWYTVQAGLDEDEQERVVGSIASTLLDTLRRNPSLVAFLLEDME